MSDLSSLSNKELINLFDDEIELTLHPLMFLTLERLCKSALIHSGNNSEVRLNVTNLYLYLARESIAKYEVETIDVVSIRKLLLEQKEQEPKHDIDVINLLAQGKRPKLGPDLVGAALIIRRIWQGFSKFLKMSARSYSRSGPKKRTRSLDPIMVMSTELLNLWSEMYKPWFEQASKKLINGNPKINQAILVLRIINDDVMPEHVDKNFGLIRGTSLRILRHQLRLFIDPGYEARQAAIEAENARYDNRVST